MLRYDQPVYRPPSEADSLIIQVALGCPHNACAFCDMYKTKRFYARPQADVLADLETAARHTGPDVRSLFLADGNGIVLSTRRLVEICQRARELFVNLERITTYGSAKYVLLKQPDELAALAAAGLDRVHMGLESGDPETLRAINKGVTPQQVIAAGRRVVDAGMELSLYVMIGVAGTERWRPHAAGSGRVVSRVRPAFVRLRTFVPRVGTPLHQRWQDGKLTLPGPHEALRETRVLIENIDCPTTLLSDHMSNFLDVSGRLLDQRAAMLAKIDDALTWPRASFRPDTSALVHLGL